MAIPIIETSFAWGEISPSLWGHVDLSKVHAAAATLRNCFVRVTGGVSSRAGTRYVLHSKQNPSPLIGQGPPQFLPFSFSLEQDYVLEFGDAYIRFITGGGYVVEAATTITGATQAAICVITDVGHGYTTGDWISIENVTGMTQINGRTFIIIVTGLNTYQLYDLDSVAINSTGYGAYTGGGTAERIYEISSPYAGANLNLLKGAQSADVLTITCPNLPSYNLSRFGATNWTITPATFGTSLSPPSSCTATATVNPSGSTSPPTLPCAFAYVVTAVDPETGQESVASPVADVTDSVDIAATAGSIIINWSPVAGASHYKVYKAPASYNTDPGSSTNALPVPAGALFGLIASAFGTQFVDSNVTPDFAQTPPRHQNPLAPGQVLEITMTASTSDWTTATVAITTSTGSGFVGQCVIVGGAIVAVIIVNPGSGYVGTDTVAFAGGGTSAAASLVVGPQTGTYASVVSYFQQRRVYADSLNEPDTYWMSQPGAFNNFDTSIPVIPSDAITGTPWSEKVDGVQWMMDTPSGLLTFTGSAVWMVAGTGSGIGLNSPAITPETQGAVPQSSIGSSATLQPERIEREVLYWEPDNATLRDLTYQLYFNTFTGTDVSWQSSHLLLGAGRKAVTRAWCRKPYYLYWAARDDGILLSLTFFKEQEVSGWAKHTTQGLVRRLCSVTELPVDALYLCVERITAPGVTRYFVERMDNRLWTSIEDTWAVDAGVATQLGHPLGVLYASLPSGPGITFNTTGPGSFTAGMVGWTLRSGGGVAVLTSYISPNSMTGNWVYPCQEVIPDDPANTPIPQQSGDWSVGAQVTTVSGLWHLVGKTVVGIADGIPVGPLVVSAAGTVTLPFIASDVKIGLGFTAQIQSLYLEAGAPTVQGRRKEVYAVTVRCEASAPMYAGANQVDTSAMTPSPLAAIWAQGGVSGLALTPAATLLPAIYPSPGAQQAVRPLFTGDIRIPIPSAWQKPAQVSVQQRLPLPLSVTALIPEIIPGDTPENDYSARQQRQRPGGAQPNA